MVAPRLSLVRSLLLGACLLGWSAPTKAQQPPQYDESLSHERSSGSTRIDKLPVPLSGEARRSRRTDVPLDVQVRQAVERAIPYIEREGEDWIRERKCLACHYARYMLWSLHDADLRGFAIDRGKLAETSRWAMNQPSMHTTGNEGAAQILIVRDRSDRAQTP